MLQRMLSAVVIVVLLGVSMAHASDRLDPSILKSVLRIETAPDEMAIPT